MFCCMWLVGFLVSLAMVALLSLACTHSSLLLIICAYTSNHSGVLLHWLSNSCVYQ